MQLSLLNGRADPALAESLASQLQVNPVQSTVEDFPDHEIHVRVEEDLQGHDVFLLQSTVAPFGDHLLELLLLADACQRAGAVRITAVIPYFGYARQDRRSEPGESVGARLLADLLSVRIHRLVTLDLHNPAIEGFFTIPVEHLSAVPLLADRLRAFIVKDSVLVAPDLGAVKLVHRYADLLDLPVAYVHKIRLSSRRVRVQQIAGEVEGRMPVLVDDMISTGNTMVSAIEALVKMGCQTPVTIVASHGLIVGQAHRNLAAVPVNKIILTDSCPQICESELPIDCVNISELLAATIKHIHAER